MKPTQITPTPCPYCGNVYDTAMLLKRLPKEAIPKSQDITICISCGELVMFGPYMNLMECKETPDELANRLGLVKYGTILLAQQEIEFLLQTMPTKRKSKKKS